MTDRAIHKERSEAQKEAAKFLNSLGWAEKHPDDETTFQRRPGVADYFGCVRSLDGPLSYVLEVKAGGLVFPMSRITDDQWNWLKKWEDKTGGYAWFWLSMGTEPINSTNISARRTAFIVSRWRLLDVKNRLDVAFGGLQCVLPQNRNVARLKRGEIYFQNNLFADELFVDEQLIWRAGRWHVKPSSPFAIAYRLGELDGNSINDSQAGAFGQ